MGFQSINPRSIHSRLDMAIAPLETRIIRDRDVGNQIIVVVGKAQQGKSNFCQWLAWEKLYPVIKKEPITLFNLNSFYNIVKDRKREGEIIILDEAQANWMGWWDLFFRILKKVVEVYGYKRHILIINTPTHKNLSQMLFLCHYLIRMRRVYSEKRHKYRAKCFLLNEDEIGNLIPEEFEVKMDVPKVKAHIWKKYMSMKDVNYDEKLDIWMELLEKKERNKEEEIEKLAFPNGRPKELDK